MTDPIIVYRSDHYVEMCNGTFHWILGNDPPAAHFESTCPSTAKDADPISMCPGYRKFRENAMAAIGPIKVSL